MGPLKLAFNPNPSKEPATPLPATVVTFFVAMSNLRMMLLPLSEKRSADSSSINETAFGVFKPTPPEKYPTPFPANCVIAPLVTLN